MKTIKILAKKTGLGNQIQFIPIIEELKKEYHIISDSIVYKELGVLEKVHPDEKADQYLTVFSYNHEKLWAELKKYRGKIAGFKYRIKKKHLGIGYSKSLKFDEDLSELENNRLLYNRFFKKGLKEMPFRIPGKNPEKGKVIFGISPKAHKTVPKSSWIELKKKIENEGYSVHTLDHDLGLGNHITTPSLSDLKDEISKAEFYVGTDSGVMHLADILKIPSLIVFGSTSIEKNGPVYKKSVVLSKGLPCAPCYDWGRVNCHIDYLCMKVDPDTMFRGFQELREKN